MKKEDKKKHKWTDSEVEPSIGLGDTVSRFIKKVSGGKIKECEPCKKRRDALNKKFPYGRKEV